MDIINRAEFDIVSNDYFALMRIILFPFIGLTTLFVLLFSPVAIFAGVMGERAKERSELERFRRDADLKKLQSMIKDEETDKT